MKQHIENTRRKLGELGAMSAQNDAMERKILARAEELLKGVEAKIDSARSKAMSGGDAEQQTYLDLIAERGRLHQVIAQAREVLVS